MIETLVQAIEDRKNLCLVRHSDTTLKEQVERAYRLYCGIFVIESGEMFEEKQQSYSFTASVNSDHIEKYVSLEVNWDRTKIRVNGLHLKSQYFGL
jgi:hypothetical protein